MVRLIDETKLIEEIDDLMDANLLFYDDASKSRQETLEEIVDLIEDQPKVGEWIPVEERLPEDNQAVLTCKNKQISILIWKAEKRKWLEPKGNWWWSYCMVEKWQPLPEPFKGD